MRLLKLILWAFASLHAANGFGITFESKNFDQLIAESEQILVGTVSGAAARRHPGGAIVTDVAFAELQAIKGSAPATLMVAGGSMGAESLVIDGLPRFQVGTAYLLFVQGNGASIFPVVGGDHGMFQIKRNMPDGEPVVFDFRGQPIKDASVLQAMGAASEGSEGNSGVAVPITLEHFLRVIRGRLGLP